MNSKSTYCPIGALTVFWLASGQAGCSDRDGSTRSHEQSADGTSAELLASAPSEAPISPRILAQLPPNAQVTSHLSFVDADGIPKTKVAFRAEGRFSSEVYETATGAWLSRPPPAAPGPLSASLRSALDALDDQSKIDVDLYLRDEVDGSLPYRGAHVSRRHSQAEWVTEIDGVSASEEDLRALHDDMRAGIAAREQARTERRNSRRRELARRLGSADPGAPGSSTAPADWLHRKVTKADLFKLAEACGDLCSIEPHREAATGAFTTADVNAEMGITQWAFPYGDTGNSVGVWIRDAGKPTANSSPPNIALNWDNITLLDSNLAEAYHTSLVLGAFQATAPNARAYIGDGNSCFIRDNLASITNPPVYLSSHSWSWLDYADGNYWECDRQWDNFVYNSGITTFFLAHNYGGYVTTPGRGYNTVAVGAYYLASPEYVADWSDYQNPVTGAEKPEIVAPGVNVTLGSWTGDGTSISTPYAAAFAADLVSYDINLYAYRPELVKAYLMAGATNNVEGSRRISDHDGAGAIWYRNTWCEGWGSWHGAYNQFFDANENIWVSWNLTSGRRYRIAISWLVSGDYTLTYQAPSSDLDLFVKWGNTNVAYSNGVNDTFEMVDFTPTHTGTHSIQIHRFWYGNNDKVALGLAVCPVY